MQNLLTWDPESGSPLKERQGDEGMQRRNRQPERMSMQPGER